MPCIAVPPIAPTSNQDSNRANLLLTALAPVTKTRNHHPIVPDHLAFVPTVVICTHQEAVQPTTSHVPTVRYRAILQRFAGNASGKSQTAILAPLTNMEPDKHISRPTLRSAPVRIISRQQFPHNQLPK